MSHANGASEKKMPEPLCTVTSRDGVRCVRPARAWGVCKAHAIKTGLSAASFDPLLDAIVCDECAKEFVPKRAGQKTCETPSCAGGIGARKRNYRKPKAAAKTKARAR